MSTAPVVIDVESKEPTPEEIDKQVLARLARAIGRASESLEEVNNEEFFVVEIPPDGSPRDHVCNSIEALCKLIGEARERGLAYAKADNETPAGYHLRIFCGRRLRVRQGVRWQIYDKGKAYEVDAAPIDESEFNDTILPVVDLDAVLNSQSTIPVVDPDWQPPAAPRPTNSPTPSSGEEIFSSPLDDD